MIITISSAERYASRWASSSRARARSIASITSETPAIAIPSAIHERIRREFESLPRGEPLTNKCFIANLPDGALGRRDEPEHRGQRPHCARNDDGDGTRLYIVLYIRVGEGDEPVLSGFEKAAYRPHYEEACPDHEIDRGHLGEYVGHRVAMHAKPEGFVFPFSISTRMAFLLSDVVTVNIKIARDVYIHNGNAQSLPPGKEPWDERS